MPLCCTPGLLGPRLPEQKALPLLPPPSCPQKVQPKGLQEGGDPGSLGRAQCLLSTLPCPIPSLFSHLAPIHPGPSQPLPLTFPRELWGVLQPREASSPGA